MGIKQEAEVLKRNNEQRTVSGLESCKISNGSSKESTITEMFKEMKLNDSKPKKKLPERKSQPKEDDEGGDTHNVSDLLVAPDNLVKLEAPKTSDKEECEGTAESPNEEAETVLGERGPMHGVPANYHMQMGYNHIASKACKPYQLPNNSFTGNSYQSSSSPSVPVNFLDYNYENTNTSQGKGSKREMDDRETCEPPKWIRPHHGGLEEINDLSTPWNAAVPAQGNANGKTLSQVYQKQMSGGIMYTPEDHFLNSGLDGQDFKDIISIGLEGDGFNIPVGSGDFMPVYEPLSPNISGIFEQVLMDPRNQMMTGVGLDFHQLSWDKSQGRPPQATQLTDTSSHSFLAQQFEEHHQQCSDAGRRKRGSFGNDDGSDGYASDLSPSHELQTSPTPSPRSVMDASPGTHSGSPPRTNWSPPPSNMSYCSVDSGVCSPMADESNGYTSMKSPRQGHVMSPKSVSLAPGTSHQSRSPPLVTSSPYIPVSSKLEVIDSKTEGYVSPYVSTHLPELDWALEVASRDLLAQYRKKEKESAALANQKNNIMSVNNRPNVYSEMASQHYPVEIQAPNGYVTPNPTMDVKMPQNFPNLPTIVPAAIQVANNNNLVNGHQISSRINQPVINGKNQPVVGAAFQQWEQPGNLQNIQTNVMPATAALNVTGSVVQVSQPMISTPVIITSTAASTLQPEQISQGKIPIAPINPKLRPSGSVIIMQPNGTVTPVFIMPQNISTKTPQRTLRALAPKDPSKQNEKPTDLLAKPCNGASSPTSCASTNHGDKPSSAPASSGKKAGESPDEKKLLNLARRLVAEMSTVDLKYNDEDGDTYLHVAVCRADKFMVQALLERLEREKLTEMIDKQNLQGQTPLYLAVSTNNAEMVQLLVEHGADVNPFAESVTSTGAIEKTAAIHCASTKGEKHLEALLALLKAGEINLNQVNSEGHTALNCAILAHGKVNTDLTAVNSIPIIRALLRAGADPNLQVQQSGKTALMYALESRDLDLIESTFQLVEPHKLPVFLKTQAFDSSSCSKIAESLKATLDPVGQQRLISCLKSGSYRGVH